MADGDAADRQHGLVRRRFLKGFAWTALAAGTGVLLTGCPNNSTSSVDDPDVDEPDEDEDGDNPGGEGGDGGG